MESKILTDLLRSGREIITSTSAVGGAGVSEGKHKSKYGTADGKHPFGSEEDALVAMFTEMQAKKKSRKFCLEYWRERIAQLVREDLA